jgi:hypothetical protein
MQVFHLPPPVVSQTYNAAPYPWGSSEDNSHYHRDLGPIQLAPLLCHALDHSAPTSAGMQRQHSVSSATDSRLSSTYASCSGSPMTMPCGSPHSERTNTPTVASSSSCSTFGPCSFHGLRAFSCLDYGDHVPGDPRQPCDKCNTTSPEHRPTGKAPRRKRTDRHLYSRLCMSGPRTQTVSRDQGECGRRRDHTALIGRHQEMLLEVNPSLITSARTGNGRIKTGWNSLRPNNISVDVLKPITYNKSDILISGVQVLDDSNRILANIRDQLITPLQSEAANLLQCNPSYVQLYKFVEHVSDTKWTLHVEESCKLRGSHDFRVPFGEESKL